MSHDLGVVHRQILENPYDITARLVYADMLEESEQPGGKDRADFIRHDIWWHTLPVKTIEDIDNHKRYGEIRNNLLGRHEQEWRRIGVCPICMGYGSAVYGSDETKVDCITCESSGWQGVLWEIEDDTWDEEHDRPYGEYIIPALWRYGFIEQVTVPMPVFATYGSMNGSPARSLPQITHP